MSYLETVILTHIDKGGRIFVCWISEQCRYFLELRPRFSLSLSLSLSSRVVLQG